jgi:hypothetical protein
MHTLFHSTNPMRILKERFETMRVTMIGATLCFLAVGLVHPTLVRAQDDISVSGEVVDMSCYLSKGLKGSQHKACAQLCAKKGVPIGLLTDSGDVYLLIDDHNNPDPYEALKKLAGDKAEVKGKKFSKGGVASILVVESKGL